MGYLRFFLSILVLVSHLGISMLGVNPGVVAVVVFYLLSGFVVQSLLTNNLNTLGLFYRDRAWRILPQYFAALLFAILIWWAGAASPFISADPGSAHWLANISIIPLNYYMYSGIDSFTLLPPAWSLGAEIQFYLLAPVLIMVGGVMRHALLLCSGGVFLLAQAGVLDIDHFGYRLLPGVLFIFMLGMWMARLRSAETRIQNNGSIGYLILIWCLLLVYLCALLSGLLTRQPYDREVVSGLLLGMPLIWLASSIEWQGWLRLGNSFSGSMAYGVFLFHFPVIWLLEIFSISTAKTMLVIVLSMLLAFAGHRLLEKPLWARYRDLP